jgi:hypothetical protein
MTSLHVNRADNKNHAYILVGSVPRASDTSTPVARLPQLLFWRGGTCCRSLAHSRRSAVISSDRIALGDLVMIYHSSLWRKFWRTRSFLHHGGPCSSDDTCISTTSSWRTLLLKWHVYFNNLKAHIFPLFLSVYLLFQFDSTLSTFIVFAWTAFQPSNSVVLSQRINVSINIS